MLTVLTACSELAMLMSGRDFLTVITTEKSIKKHAYEKGKDIYGEALGLIEK
jgi:hypothetical protein